MNKKPLIYGFVGIFIVAFLIFFVPRVFNKNKYVTSFGEEYMIIVDPVTGSDILANNVIVSFRGTVSEELMSQIEQEIGRVIHVLRIEDTILSIKIPGNQNVENIDNSIDKLLKYPEVKYAEYNYLGSVDWTFSK